MTPSEVETLRAFYVSHRQALYTYAVALCRHRESAEDALQAVFQRLLGRRSLPADLRPFVFKSLRFALIDQSRRSATVQDSIFELQADAGQAGDRPTDLAGLDRWLAELSQDERETIVLKIYDDFTFADIAELRKVPLPTVSSWYRRGIEKLRALPVERL